MKQIINDILEDSSFPQGVAWKQKSFNPEEIIVQENDIAESLFFIQQGTLQVTLDLISSKKEATLSRICLLNQGDIFGETSLCQTGTRSASVTAITHGTLVEINGERLSIYLDDHPIQGYLFYKQLFEIQVSRVKNTNLQVEKLLTLTDFIKS